MEGYQEKKDTMRVLKTWLISYLNKFCSALITWRKPQKNKSSGHVLIEPVFSDKNYNIEL